MTIIDQMVAKFEEDGAPCPHPPKQARLRACWLLSHFRKLEGLRARGLKIFTKDESAALDRMLKFLRKEIAQ